MTEMVTKHLSSNMNVVKDRKVWEAQFIVDKAKARERLKTGATGQRLSHEVSRLSRSLPCWRCPPWWSWRPKALQLLCLLGNRCLHLATATTATLAT